MRECNCPSKKKKKKESCLSTNSDERAFGLYMSKRSQKCTLPHKVNVSITGKQCLR